MNRLLVCLLIAVLACVACGPVSVSERPQKSTAGLVAQTWSGFCQPTVPVCIGARPDVNGNYYVGDPVRRALPNQTGIDSNRSMVWRFYDTSEYSTHQELLLSANPNVGLSIDANNNAVLATCDHQLYGPCDLNIYYGVIDSWYAYAKTGQCMALDNGSGSINDVPLMWTPCANNTGSQNWTGVGFTTMWLTDETNTSACGFAVPMALDTSSFFPGGIWLSNAPTQCAAPNSWGIPFPTAHQEGFLLLWDYSSSTIAISHTDYGSYAGVTNILTLQSAPPPVGAKFQAPNSGALQEFVPGRCNETGGVDSCLAAFQSNGNYAFWGAGNGYHNGNEYETAFTVYNGGLSTMVVRALYR